MANKISKVVGIDLGTTNSVISIIGPDNQTIICGVDEKFKTRRTFPSALAWVKRRGAMVVGQTAFNLRGTTPEPVTSIKRHMGDANYRASLGEKELSPVEVSAEILKAMKEHMQATLEKTPGCENWVVDRAVITIPAYFRSEAMEDTARAGKLAGLEVMKTLQEPSAASAYYCWKNGVEDGIFLVYDLGGGTFDVSIVRYDAGDAAVVGISGNNYLGGDTFDDLLAKMLLEYLQDEGYALDLNPNDEKDRQRMTKLRLAAEIIKKELSDKEEFFYMQDGLFQDQEGAMVNLSIEVTRQEFENLIRPALQGTLEKCQEALAMAEKAEVTLDDIDGVLLVGGSSHIPLVQEFVREHFCDPALEHHTIQPEPFHDDPDMSVGFGAAVAAKGFSEISFTQAPADEAPGGDALILAAEVQPAICAGGKSTVSGCVKAMAGQLPPGMTARVAKADGSYIKDFPVKADDGSFKFSGLPAPTKDEPYQCTVEADGKALLTFPFNAGAEVIRAASTTLAHALFVELQDVATQRSYLKELMPNGTNLPASSEHQFKTTSEYSASIKIFEENTQLCNIVLTFPNPVSVGSPVTITLEIDEKSTKSVRATAAGESQLAVLEAPELPPVTEAEIRESVSSYNSNVQALPHTQQILAEAKRRKVEALEEEALQAVAENDQVRARTVRDELETMVKEVGGQPLSPPEDEIQKLAAECVKLNREHHKNDANNAEKIRGYQDRAARAYAQRNQDELTRAHRDLQALRDILKPEQGGGGGGGGDGEPPMWLIVKMGFCPQILELMRQAQENSKLPPPLRKKMEAEYGPDKAKVDQVEQQMQPWTEDGEARAAAVELQPIHKRWKYYAEYGDLPQ